MKTIKQITIALLVVSSVIWNARAQGFTSGSTGAFGPLSVTANTTLDVPPDGIFHCTTINIGGFTLTFRKNAMNTPVYLLATGDVVINGTINVNGVTGDAVSGGQSGPGGFNGGNPGSVSTPPGAGYGPGAGKGGTHTGATTVDGAGPANYATVGTSQSTNKGSVYGSALLIPIIGGSGGGGSSGTPGFGGGGGGGAILIASNTRIQHAGTISADGGGGNIGVPASGGSGGAIRLVAPAITGSGQLRVFGGQGAGAGRIRIDTQSRAGLAFGFSPAGISSIGSMMIVFPTPNPRLDIIEAAGTAIPVGSGPVSILLPFGSTPNRTIRVQARDFNDVVPITLQLTPDHGTPVTYQAQIDTRTANPAQTDVNVTLPVNVQVAVDVWTR